MRASFCPYCGSKLTKKEIGDEGLVPYCVACLKPIFAIPCPCVIVLCINKNDEAILIRQSYGDDRYVLVAGYLQLDENFEECVLREVHEELNLEATNVKYIGSYYQSSRENIMAAFVCNVSGEIALSSEVKEARSFHIEEAILMLKEASIAKKVVEDYIKMN